MVESETWHFSILASQVLSTMTTLSILKLLQRPPYHSIIPLIEIHLTFELSSFTDILHPHQIYVRT